MLNFGKVPPLTAHAAHLTVQIFAVIKPVVSESKVLARNENIRDLEGFFFPVHTHTQGYGLQRSIKAV